MATPAGRQQRRGPGVPAGSGCIRQPPHFSWHCRAHFGILHSCSKGKAHPLAGAPKMLSRGASLTTSSHVALILPGWRARGRAVTAEEGWMCSFGQGAGKHDVQMVPDLFKLALAPHVTGWERWGLAGVPSRLQPCQRRSQCYWEWQLLWDRRENCRQWRSTIRALLEIQDTWGKGKKKKDSVNLSPCKRVVTVGKT